MYHLISHVLLYLSVYLSFPTNGYASDSPVPVDHQWFWVALPAFVVATVWLHYRLRRRLRRTGKDWSFHSDHFLLKAVPLFVTFALLPSCATPGKSILLGMGIGATTGGTAGAIATNNRRGTLLGALVGAAFGGVTGLIIHDEEVDKRTKLEGLDKVRKLNDPDVPSIKAPEASCVKLNERIEDNTYFGPQLKCTIDHPATFTR
jgi:Glycine zipper